MACQYSVGKDGCDGNHIGHGWHEFEGDKIVFRPAPAVVPGEVKPADWFYMGMPCDKSPAGVDCPCVADYGMACGPCRAAFTCDCEKCESCVKVYGL